MSHLFFYLQPLAKHLTHSKSSTNTEKTNGSQMKHHVERGDPSTVLPLDSDTSWEDKIQFEFSLDFSISATDQDHKETTHLQGYLKPKS